jgi:hypothetical protein
MRMPREFHFARRQIDYNMDRPVHRTSVADPDPGSGAFWTPGPGSGIRNGFIPDPGSQTHIFLSLMTNFWEKSSIILAQIFFFSISIFNFVKFSGYKKRDDN